MAKVTLYHLTRPENVKNIRKNGLKASTDGYVYLFEDETIDDLVDVQIDVSDSIALNQCGITGEYAIFEVSVPADALEPDNVGECTSGFQYRIKGDIDKRNLKYCGTRAVEIEKFMYNL